MSQRPEQRQSRRIRGLSPESIGHHSRSALHTPLPPSRANSSNQQSTSSHRYSQQMPIPQYTNSLHASASSHSSPQRSYPATHSVAHSGTTGSISSNLSVPHHATSQAPSTNGSDETHELSYMNENPPVSFVHRNNSGTISEASSSQYHSALHSHAQLNPYNMNNFDLDFLTTRSTSSNTNAPSPVPFIPGPFQYNAPFQHSIPTPKQQYPLNAPHHTPTQQYPFLSHHPSLMYPPITHSMENPHPFQNVISNLESMVSDLRNQLKDMQQKLDESHNQNKVLQSELIAALREKSQSSSSTVSKCGQPPVSYVSTTANNSSSAPTVKNDTHSEKLYSVPETAAKSMSITPKTSNVIPSTLAPIPHDAASIATTLEDALSTTSDTSGLASVLGKFLLNHDQMLSKLVENSESKKAPSTTNFPTLTNKQTSREEFSTWYFTVISVLATKDWSKLYDPDTQDVILDGTLFPDVNNHLFSALLSKSKEDPSDLIQSLKNLWGNGVSLLRELRTTYYGTLTKDEVHNLQSKLLSNHWCRLESETIQHYASRTMNAYRDLLDHGIQLSKKVLKERFIHNLGPEFTSIKEDMEWDRLHPEWESDNIVDLVQPARKVLQIKHNLQAQNRIYRQLQSASSKPPEKPPEKPSSDPKVDDKEKQLATEKRRARQKKILEAIKNGTFKISDFTSMVPPGACVYHGHKHRDATDSSKECGHLKDLMARAAQALKTPENSSPPTVVKAKQVSIPTSGEEKSEQNQDNDLDEVSEALDALSGLGTVLNDNNNDTTLPPYFQVFCKNVHTTTHPAHDITVVDSGAFPMMFNDKKYFFHFIPWNSSYPLQHVTLADGDSKAKIEGIGTVRFLIDNKFSVELKNVLYVPSLSTNLFSLKEFLRYKGCFNYGYNNTMLLAFPTFVTQASINDEICLHTTPSKIKPMFSTVSALTHSAAKTPPLSSVKDTIFHAKCNCQKLKQQLPSVIHSDKNIDVISEELLNKPSSPDTNESPPIIDSSASPTPSSSVPPQFDPTKSASSSEPKSKPKSKSKSGKSGLPDVIIAKCDTPSLPSWIHHNCKVTIKLPKSEYFIKGTLLRHTDNDFLLSIGRSRRTAKTTLVTTPTLLSLYNNGCLLQGHTHLIRNLSSHDDTRETTIPPVPLPTEHKPLSNWPEHTSMSIDYLRKSFGFRQVDNILPQMKETAKPNFSLSSADREKIIDLGEVATIRKSRASKETVDLPLNFGSVFHMDIIYGTVTAFQGIKYALFLVDRATRHKFILPMRNLKTDLVPTLQLFIKYLGFTPKRFVTDYDHKLMGRAVLDQFQNENGEDIFETSPHLTKQKPTEFDAAPPNKQNQNGLAEANWKAILYMARSWLTSHLLPSKYWWWALKRATELSNYLPIKIDNKLTSPHELLYADKPDYRNIIPQFSVAYLHRYRDGTIDRKNTHSKSIRAILVGRDPKSASFLFYHPGTKKTLTSDSFTIDETLPSGPAFGLNYDGGLYFNKYSDFNDSLRPPQFKPDQEVFITSFSPPKRGKVITIPRSHQHPIYSIQFDDNSIHQFSEDTITDVNPNAIVEDNNPPLSYFPKWIKHMSRATIFTSDMEKPIKGHLLFNNNEWYLRGLQNTGSEIIHLEDFDTKAHNLCSSMQLFQGHPRYTTIQKHKAAYTLTSAIAKHVSARNLTSEEVPTLIKHKYLNANDKAIWDEAYAEEYNGLMGLPCWSTITEAEYRKNKKEYITLPSMAISTIKYDEHGHPKRAKYRIVALGNLESHKWTKAECYAPVMSLLELRLLTALAVKNKRVLKNFDIKQAFVQSVLPENEKYVVKPPVGCPHTPPNSYWRLIRSLYGLRRAPRHWYDKITKTMKEIGLTPCPNAPCLFRGEIIPGQPPIYLGMYVDDCAYFSASDEVEKEFERRLSKHYTVDYMGKVSHFLGIKFQWRETKDRVSVHLSQEAFADRLINDSGLMNETSNIKATPFRSGAPVDSIKTVPMSETERDKIRTQLQSYVGSLLWLSQATRPDLSVITSILAKHQRNPSPGHIKAAKYVIQYLKGTKNLGITFHSDDNLNIQSFIHFPIKNLKVYAKSDANWGPQDQSVPKYYDKNEDQDLFKTRSISGYLLALHGPLHWAANRQHITARSTAEAEIYATDECVKSIIRLSHIIKDLHLEQDLLSFPTKVYNDNMACVQWSKNKTTRAIRHIQIRENASREAVQKKLVEIEHVDGKLNYADIFTKEQKDTPHFLKLRNILLSPPFPPENDTNDSQAAKA